ncbi:MAG: hypothetical protein PHR27_09765, partial [Candidatus Cloacimonetes bacterium]|nr:hypothetical protein [Candidatus Cloacimonadota bacterium]
RLTDRGPRVMAAFRESPIIGFGFSGGYYANQDGHVGNQNMLLHGGILGYLVWMFIFLSISVRIFTLSRRVEVKSMLAGGGSVFALGMLASFMIHSSSGQIWGFYSSGPGAQLHWAWLLAAANVSLLAALRHDPSIHQQTQN